MQQPVDHNLAQLNIGRLLAPTDDPRVAEFMGALDRINGLAKRMPGYVWMMEGSGAPNTGNTGTAVGDDAQMVSNLTVWTDVETLEDFVWNTVHRQFYERRLEWFEALGDLHFVMWWVPAGHQPTMSEALERLHFMRQHGASDHAFDWAWLEQAKRYKTGRCGAVAAE